jgi:hypothetical protein
MANAYAMISRRWLINSVLILLIILFTYIGNKYNVKNGYQPENRITHLKAADINAISIKAADISISLSKVDGIWQIETPVLWYADNITVERIINIVNAQTDSKLPISEIDPATLGLQFPKAILRLNNTQITFGATNNIGERRYVQIGDTVFLLKDRYLPFITQGITGLLDRRLLPRAVPLKTLKLPDLELDQQQENVWTPDSAGLTASQAGQIIENWQTLQSERVEHYRADQTPKQKVTALLETGGEIEFHVLAITPQLVIARSDLGFQYHFKEKDYYGLLAAMKNESRTD